MASPSLNRVTASVTIMAAPERVFDAWLDPRIASRFLAAGATHVGEFENDPRESGSFKLVMQDEDAGYRHEGRYVLIDRPHRLVFTWISSGTDMMLSLVSVTFTAVDGGVRVDIEHEGIPKAEKARQHEIGWATILVKLSQVEFS